MASEKESPCQDYCGNDPNFAIICSFFDRFAVTCGITYPTFAELQEMIENTQDVQPELIDLHVKLLRKIRRSVAAEKWERALIKFCHSYLCSEEGWELERCGYKKCKVPVRLKILKTLLDAQFDLNSKFKNDINKLTPEELRLEPLGRDKVGQSYWCQFDAAANVRVYKEDQDEETWGLVAKDREGLVSLITQLSSGEELLELELINEDSNSQEVEKPIIDTGQVEQSTSEENTVDSVVSKNENIVKEENGHDVSLNEVSNNVDSHKEVIENVTSSEVKLEGDKEKSNEENECTNLASNSHDQISPSSHESEPLTAKVEAEKQNEVSSCNNNGDISRKADEESSNLTSARTVESETPTENRVNNACSTESQHPESGLTSTGEIKDVAEEIKQRSLTKSTCSLLFKGKIGNSTSGSKLDKIFGHKLEQSNVIPLEKHVVDDIKERNIENKSLRTDDDSCSQNLIISNDQEEGSVINEYQVKRKADEVLDQPSKKKCVEEESDTKSEPEVGEEIEEPVMIIKGEGSGQDCETGNPGLDSDDGVVSENVKNTTRNTDDKTFTSTTNENNSENHRGDTALKGSLNNGMLSDNQSVNEAVKNLETDSTQNCLNLSKNDDSERYSSDIKRTPYVVESHDKEIPEIEKSIEEQLSDLTGEGLSPKSSCEFQPAVVENSKENVVLFNNSNPEKGIRRKSLDSTENVDCGSTPPEAKKTKIQKDCNDIFGTDDSMPYTGEENKLVDKSDSLKERLPDSTVSKNDTEENKIETGTELPEIKLKNSEKNLYKSGSSSVSVTIENNNISVSDINGTDSKFNRANKSENVVKEANGKSKNELPEAKNCSTDNIELKINDEDKKVDSSNCNNDDKKIEEKLEAGDIAKESEETDSTAKLKKDLDSENKSTKSDEKSHCSNEENCENNCEKNASEENVNEECPEKKKKIDFCDDGLKEDQNKSDENKAGMEEAAVQKVKSNSTLKDENQETAKKIKTPLKKSPKPRRKVFTPKSRKNKNKNIKLDHSHQDSLQGDGNNAEKSTVEGDAPDHEKGTAKDGESTPGNKEIKIATAKSIAGRKRRNSRKNTSTDKESEEDPASDKKANTEEDEEEEVGGKRRKVKGKRAPNKSIRKSVEDKRNKKSSSEEENDSDDNINKDIKKSPKEAKKASANLKTIKNIGTNKNKPGKAKSQVKPPSKTKKDDASKKKEEETVDNDKSDETSEKKKTKSKSQGRNSRAYLGINLDIDINDTSRSVRQSSRIAQIKIKEQADHKHGEETRSHVEKSGKKNKKKKDDSEEGLKGTPKKKKKTKKISDEDVPEDEPPSERKKRKKKKRKHPVKAFNERDPWKSSSGSSSEAEEEEEDHFDDIVEEEEDIPLTIKSDHEFSPESDLEADEEWKPVRRARTAQKVKEPTEEVEESLKDLDDFACEKCGKKDHPEWILLCDTCNHGWHASCLRPSLMLVPEGDWHCPPCQHAVLVKKLQETLKIYDRDTKRRENEELRRKRLAYVGISLDNVLPANAHHPKEKASGSESSESSESRSESESEYSDEPVYQLRQRRQGPTSYRFNEFDELINSAIRDEVEGSGAIIPAPVPFEGTAEVGDGEAKPVTTENKVDINGDGLENSVPDKISSKSKEESDEDSSDKEEDSKNEDEEEDEFPRVVPKRTALPRPGRKKHRKLNSLDDPSDDDDDDDDEDFKGSSSEEEEEEDEDDDSDESGVGRRRSRRGNAEPVRRSSRARKSRFDKEFINDDSEESDAPRRKKTKKLWSESDSESDDSTWGRRKKKKNYGSSSRGKKFKKSKKFTIEDELSDLESSKTPKKKRQRKVKYGGLDDLAVDDLPTRRTRGKKINYQEVLGTDSDEDIQKSKSFKKTVIDDDDEFDAEKEKQESAASSADKGWRFGEEESDEEEKSSNEEEEEGEEGESEDEVKNVKNQSKKIENKDEEHGPKLNEKEEIKAVVEKVVDTQANKVSPPKLVPTKVSPPKVVSKDKPPARRGRPPKAMIAPPPERLISEDEQYKAVVSKVATVGHNMSEIGGAKAVNVSDYPQKFSETKDFIEPPQPVTPVKIPNSSFDPKLVKRSPPIKIRSGVPVNAGMKSPSLGSPINDPPLFPVKSPNSDSLHSPPDGSHFQMQRPLIPQQMTVRKPVNTPLPNVKTEVEADEEDPDDEELMEDIEEEDDDEEEDSDDDVLEEGEIPKKVARRMARMEERMERLERKKLAKQMEKLKSAQSGAVSVQPVSPGAAQPALSTASTQPSQPLLRVVSPLKLMANPPGPLQSTFMNPSVSPRMPVGSPPPARMPMAMRPPQPTNLAPAGESGSRRGRGRGKKQEKEEMMVPAAPGGSVIRGILQQPQSYPPSHYPPQQFPPSHPRIPFRPPFLPGHPHPLDPSPSGGGPINVKQESSHPVSSPVHIPSKPPISQPYHPQHRFDSRPPGYPPQGNPRPQFGSYPPPPVSSAGYHYGSYPPPPQPPTREEYAPPPSQPQYNEQFNEQPPVTTPPTSKSYSEEEGGGEFGGLVSYFSSQREEDIDT